MDEQILTQLLTDAPLLGVLALFIRAWLKQNGVAIGAKFEALSIEIGSVRETLSSEIRAVQKAFKSEIDSLRGMVAALEKRVDKLEAERG